MTILDMRALVDGYAGKKLYFEMVWDAASSGHRSSSYSRAFAVAGTQAQAEELASLGGFKDSTPVKPEGPSDDAGGVSSSGAASTQAMTPVPSEPGSTSASVDPALTSASSPAPAGSTGVDPRPSAAPASSSGGLSKGAIAGIAVAAVLIGLALLAGLIFCLVRRRRRDRLAARDGIVAGGGGVYGSHTPDVIAQKEAGAGVEVSPHSPYSDDGDAAAAGGRGVVHQAPARHEEMPLAGYTDRGGVGSREVADGESLSGSGRLTPGRATPTAVRHLVEEGMTEDQIRRLEEEERELDQAIEEAGDRRR